jgi:riboflavin kinase/FMN adenylyltransferase
VAHFRSFDNLSIQNAWLTIGIFDGVHRGHQEILRALVAGALAASAPSIVLTFTPHPAVVLGGMTDFKCLTTLDERAALLTSYGVDHVITQTFDRALADQTAQEFMQKLSNAVGIRKLIVGYDTALGRGRAGTSDRLAEIGKSLNYTVNVIPPLRDEQGILSSTRIRKKIAAGLMAEASNDLGRPYMISGPVIHGDGRGRTLNLPTANILIPDGKILPAFGIYACRGWVDGQSHPAATSIGVRPTFYNGAPPAPTIEAHLLDFNGNLYGREVKLEFLEYLRPEEKYTSVEALLEQIGRDIEKTRAIVK